MTIFRAGFRFIFILNEFFTSAWRAHIDGESREIFQVNGNQVGIPFSAGSHTIEFRYAPRSALIGFRLAGFMLLIGLLVSLALLFKNREWR